MKPTLLAVAVLVACQSGDSRPTPPPSRRAPTRVLPASGPITPMRVVAGEPVVQTDAAAPFTLTASDGSGLELTRVDAKAVVEGPLAFSELHLYFKNPEDRTREGTFAITLPSGAAVSRFAMETDGKWQEAEVVEKAMARRVYDDYLHRRQDPALLEKAAGNQFTAKVFPIPAEGEKHLVVSFSQELAGRGYVLPLRGLPKTARVDVALTMTSLDGTPHEQTLSQKDWQPDRDFVAQVSDVPAAVTSGNLVVGALAIPDPGSAGSDAPHGITVLVDTSASRALGFAAYIARVHNLIDAVRIHYGDQLPLQVYAFDQFLQLMHDGTANGYDDAVDHAILERSAAGASNLDAALQQLARGTHLQRLVVITDGVMTAGPETPALVEDARKAGFERIDVVLAGGIRDERMAASLARGLPHAGDVFDLDHGIDAIVTGLGQAVAVNVAIDVPGAAWVYPRTLPAARPGSSQMVYARMQKPTRAIEVVIGNTRSTVNLGTTQFALIDRAVSGAEIEEMENKLATAQESDAKKLREDITKKSIASRVVSSQTSMLVLESDDDYDRYHIPRNALADILTVGPGGVLELQHRTMVAKTDKDEKKTHAWAGIHSPVPMPEPHLARAEAIDQARNAGILGSSALAQEGGDFASLTGSGDISSGVDDSNIYGGLLGNEAGEMNGGFGFGRSGFGPGGGGDGWGTIGTGRYGSIGHGSGTGSGYGVGGGRGGMRGRTAAVPTVSIGQPTAQGDLDKAIIRRYIKRNIQKITYCYEKRLLAVPSLSGTVQTQFFIAANGTVASATASGLDREVANCVADVIKGIEFPHPRGGGGVLVHYPFTFRPGGDGSGGGYTYHPPPPDTGYHGPMWITPPSPPRPRPAPVVTAPTPDPVDPEPWRDTDWYDDSDDYDDGHASDQEDRGDAPLEGKLADVTAALAAKNVDKALAIAKPWHEEAPGDVLALIAYAESVQAKDPILAARLYGSIIDLFPTRADMRRFAGERLESSAPDNPDVAQLVVDTYRKAVADRPDHATGHRLLAYALLRTKDYQGALDAIIAGVDQKYPYGRFLGAKRVMREDMGIIAAVYLKAQPSAEKKVTAELTKREIKKDTAPSTRFVMYWETDANDVDFHIRDARGGHAWYSHKKLRSGGRLYADITTGYGPECFTIPGHPTAGPYKLSINYFSQGPMGYGMGLLQVLRYDGNGSITLQDRPYVIMTDHAFVELGSY